MHSRSETDLLRQLHSGHTWAFDKLYNHYSRKLYQFAFSLLKNKEDAEGIVQEVFLTIWHKRTDISLTKSFKSYLFTISSNLIIDLLRKRLKEKEYLAYLEKYFIADTPTPDLETEYNLMKSKIEQVVETLPEKRKQIYKLSREKGLSQKEISEQLGISVKTVENQITLALKQIKDHLGSDMLLVSLFIFLLVINQSN